MNTSPFGYAIVDKDGNPSKVFYDDIDIVELKLPHIDAFFTASAPHRLVELYTKEQLTRRPLSEGELSDIWAECAMKSDPLLEYGLRIQAMFGIVESGSKGES